MDIEEIMKDSTELLNIIKKNNLSNSVRYLSKDINKVENSKEYFPMYKPLRDYLNSLDENRVYNLMNFMYFGRGKLDGTNEEGLTFQEFMKYPVGPQEKDLAMCTIEEKIMVLPKYILLAQHGIGKNQNYN